VKRRILAVAGASAALLLGTVGCTVPSDSPTSEPGGKVESIFFSNILPSYPPLAEADTCLREEAERQGIEADTSGPTGLQTDNQVNIDLVSQAIANGYDAIILQPIDKAQFTPVMEQAKAAGILLATMNTGDTTDIQDFTIGTDYGNQGATIAAALAERDGQQNVGIIGPTANGTHILFRDGFIAGIDDQGIDNVSFVAEAFDDADPNKTVDTVNSLLTAHPEINVVLSWTGASSTGIITAIREKNAIGEIVGVTNDVTDEVVQAINDGVLYGTSKQNFCEMAIGAVQNLIALGNGEAVEPAIDSGITFVTKENVDEEAE
jgi:ribose transport system substrate-binding protein